jgi:transposase
MAHHWARKIRQLGHAVVLFSPHLVRPYVRRKKADRTDAMALVEAYRHGQIRPVPVKTPDQQLLTSLHRLRAGWLRERTARLNTLRGLLREQGFSPRSAPRCVRSSAA